MNILITAGGTSESIDSVRHIANYSTGRLGGIIANKFASKNSTVTYLHGSGAILPSAENANYIKKIPISNTRELLQKLENLLTNHKYDCVIHSMAVSDFTPQAISSLEDIIASVVSRLHHGKANHDADLATLVKEAILSAGHPPTDSKLSSNNENMMILLKQTPKAIKLIKALQPNTQLVGFKLLSHATKTELYQAATNLLTQNACDYVLANDLSQISGDTHKAILINKSGHTRTAQTKQEIAEIIYKAVTEESQ